MIAPKWMWKMEAEEILIRDWPDFADRAIDVIWSWEDEFPFGDMPVGYAVLNALETAHGRHMSFYGTNGI